MMFHRKSVAAVAAVTAALAVAVPTTSANAAPAAPARTALIGAGGRLVPGSLPCQFLIGELRFAAATHRLAWATFLSNAFVYSGCGGAAI
jgi:hypothetical protein